MKILAFGEILWDIIKGEEHLGGAPFNFAAHLAKCGNQPFIVSRLGDDPRGLKAFSKCKDLGVNNGFIQWDHDHPTGVVDVELHNGQPDYTIRENAAYDFISIDTSLTEASRNDFEVFYFGSLAQRNEVSANTLKYIVSAFSFQHVLYDVNLRKGGYNKQIIENSLRPCTIFKLNAEELPVIASLLFEKHFELLSFCKMVRSNFPKVTTIVITASEKGSYVYHNGLLDYLPGRKVELVDAVGAGDAFSAAFIHVMGVLNDPIEASKVANLLGAYVASQRGPIPDYTPEIRDMLNQYLKEKPGSTIML
jgi:fructokinase